MRELPAGNSLFYSMKPIFTDKTICKILTKEFLYSMSSSVLQKSIYLQDGVINVCVNLAGLEVQLIFFSLKNSEKNLDHLIENGRVIYKISESNEEESGVLILRDQTLINYDFNNIKVDKFEKITNHSLFIELLEENNSFKEWLVWNVL